MNRYPWWKNLLVIIVLVVAVLYALPNFFGQDPALQVSADRGAGLDAEVLERARSALAAADLPLRGASLDEQGLLLRFDDTDTQLAAQDVVRAALGGDYVVALNLAPATPQWLRGLNAQPMFLGLDLRGGVHFLMEVDMAQAMNNARERIDGDVRSALRDAQLHYRRVEPVDTGVGGVVVTLRDAANREQAVRLLRDNHPEARVQAGAGDDSVEVLIREEYADETRRLALQQNITTLRNRVNELGVAEPIIQQQGDSRIIVQLPGVQDTARAKDVLGATATLEFKLVDEEHDLSAAIETRAPPGSRLYPMRIGGQILLKNRTILTGEHITDAASGFDQVNGGAVVHVSLDGQGARQFERITGENIGKRLAVIFIENQRRPAVGADGEAIWVKETLEEVITAPVIRDRLGRRFQITGLDSSEEARDLALLLRAGSLAAPLTIIEERTVGPSLGQDNIAQGVRSIIVGLVLVVGFMLFWYRGYGAVANVALAANLFVVVAVMSLLQATLTLPGIAGMVLTLGMAVDANVLIFERIREERRAGNSPQASINAGYGKAFSTILDANVTTLIAALVLFIFGTGPVKGFAVTLSIGILSSMFTAIVMTRAIVNAAQQLRLRRQPARGAARRS